MTAKHYISLVLTLALATCFLLPVEYTDAPPWAVTVVDEQGVRLGHVLVRESYQNYSVETEGREQDRYTDRDGMVTFEPKRGRSTWGKELLVSASSATGGVHASFGPYAYVFTVSGSLSHAVEGTSDTWKGGHGSMQTKLLLPADPGHSR